jgi:hypothetical protein
MKFRPRCNLSLSKSILSVAANFLIAASASATQISPVVECVANNGNGTYTAIWGYDSHYDPNGVGVSKTVLPAKALATSKTTSFQTQKLDLAFHVSIWPPD